MIAVLPAAVLLGLVPPPKPEVHAVIVANNHSVTRNLSELEYADDDGARYFELLGLAADRVALLSVLDTKTQRLHPRAAAVARPPTRAELEAALETTFAAIERSRAAGLRTIFYFVYAGHGSLDERGEGVMHLADGYFSRGDLFRKVLKRSPATINHVIVDACHAYLMVARRGGDPEELDKALATFLDEESISAYPNTGLLLATSKATEVHEWERFSAGVFSHEVRSALVGAADVEADGEVTYAEVRAFLSAANAEVQHASARLEVYGRAPSIHLEEPLFSRAWTGSAPVLRVPGSMAGRYWLEDERGVRYADFHSARDETVELVLVPSDAYYLRSSESDLTVPSGMSARLDASRLPRQSPGARRRGAEESSFRRHLFALPFGQAFFRGFRASRPTSDVSLTERSERAWIPRVWIGSSGLAAAAAGLAVGIGFGISRQELETQYAGAIGSAEEVRALRDRADEHGAVANAAFVTAGVLAVSGTLLLLWPEE